LDAYRAFRHRDYRFLLAGTFLATIANQMLSVAVGWDLYARTHSALVLGNVGFVQVAPTLLFTLFAGHLADRRDRRLLMVITQIAAFAAALIPLFGGASVSTLYTCLFLTATARTFQWPVRGTLLPHAVPADSLDNAIKWNSSFFEVASMSGPAIGGLLIAAFGSSSVYEGQAACALLAAGCYAALHYRSPRNAESRALSLHSMFEGVRFLWSNKLMLSAVSLDLFGVLFGGAVALLPIYAVDILGGGARTLGWLRAAPSVGAVAMAVTQAHLPGIRKPGPVLLWAVTGFGVATIVFGASRNLWISLAALFITGALDNISVVLRQTLVQGKTPDIVRGRVLAATSVFISCSNQIGAVESGWAAAWLGTVPSVVAGGGATILVVAICAAVSPSLRGWREQVVNPREGL
jgi:MFS family permease